MGQAKQRAAEIKALKENNGKSYRISEVICLVKKTATLLIDHGVQLTEELIFKDEDVEPYMMLASEMLMSGEYRYLQDAMEAHDKSLDNDFGVDLSQYNGDWSLISHYEKYVSEKKKLPLQQQFEVALFDGINGFYRCNNLI